MSQAAKRPQAAPAKAAKKRRLEEKYFPDHVWWCDSLFNRLHWDFLEWREEFGRTVPLPLTMAGVQLIPEHLFGTGWNLRVDTLYALSHLGALTMGTTSAPRVKQEAQMRQPLLGLLTPDTPMADLTREGGIIDRVVQHNRALRHWESAAILCGLRHMVGLLVRLRPKDRVFHRHCLVYRTRFQSMTVRFPVKEWELSGDVEGDRGVMHQLTCHEVESVLHEVARQGNHVVKIACHFMCMGINE